MAAVGVSDPGRCVYVGDRLFDDVWGAQQAGMRAVHIPHSAIPHAQVGHSEGIPDAVAHRLRELQLGEQTIDLGALEQLVDDGQARTIGALLEWLFEHGREGGTVRELAEQALAAADERGLYALGRLPDLVGVRRYELMAAIDRLRSLRLLEAR